MKFTKYNNPSKKHYCKKMSRMDADILAAKAAFDDKCRGIDLPLSVYDEMSDKMCGKESRHIYDK